jgi:hypothetical protein
MPGWLHPYLPVILRPQMQQDNFFHNHLVSTSLVFQLIKLVSAEDDPPAMELKTGLQA